MATIYEVSKLAGVSLATVSRVMNNNARVSDKTRKKVKEAMEQLGYRPNSIAQSLASNRSNSVGILVSELHGSFYGQMMSGIESELRAAGKHVIITTGYSEQEKEIDGIEFLLSRNCDAIILHVEAVSDEYLIELSKKSTPIFIMSRYVDSLKDRCISLNNEMGGYLATKTLIDKGHSIIGFIGGPEFKADSRSRLQGHKRALKEYNINFDEKLYFEGDFKETGGISGLRALLKKNKNLTAIACANDEMASGAMKYAREHGFNLPEGLSIIGFDNIIFANYLYPTLTTINNPVYEMGHMAAKLVLKTVYNVKNLNVQHVFDPTVIERNSVSKR
ncbi:LacI family DNA-binding transcriptional regulator [Thalassotalea piscium]